MQTIAFYSYKGGVGRTLLVANAARFLWLRGKAVVALDLDFEAPGLHYKFGRMPDADGKLSFAGGAVPYLVATAQGARNPPPLSDHLVDVAVPQGARAWLRLMPAGPAPRPEYWNALKQLRERLRFDDPAGRGVAAVLDLHARLQDELRPDYLLIDARTGVTELGGLATTALADCVVCLLVANFESVDGTLALLQALQTSVEARGRRPLRMVPVVARMPSGLVSESLEALTIKQYWVHPGLYRLREFLRRSSADASIELPVLPEDAACAVAGRLADYGPSREPLPELHQSYLELFELLFGKRCGAKIRRRRAGPRFRTK